jgi:site-specific DNA-methyltransferase (cytosine-N4-specific)
VNRTLIGDCRLILPQLIAQGVRVNCVVTSPPYWGLRDYGTAKWEGGSEECGHVQLDMRIAGMDGSTANSQRAGRTPPPDIQYRNSCAKCGALRIDAQIGLEPTLDAYVQTMVEVFRLVRELLADDGTLWLNMGDSYAATTRGAGGNGKQHTNAGSVIVDRSWAIPDGLKPKDLCGVPWHVAFALQADGWYLRQDIIWAKPNPMPESVTDRCTKAHEYVFLLAKRPNYYFDQEAIREPNTINPNWNYGSENYRRDITQDEIKTNGNFRSPKSSGPGWSGFAATGPNGTGRNRRSVWTIPSEPFPDAHFATFPQALVEPCIMAGSRQGDIVLDPFMGSGTVAQVAQRLGRQWLGIELNPGYAPMVDARTRQLALDLAPL